MKKMMSLLLALVSICAIAGPIDVSLQYEVEHSVKNGLRWLSTQQQDDGSWNHYPAITAMALMAIRKSHTVAGMENPVIQDGYAFLEKCVQENGAIYTVDQPVYNTAICMQAFKMADLPRYQKIVDDATLFLLGKQFDESESVDSDSLWYGGVGYDSEDRPDLSNLQWALESLRDLEFAGTERKSQYSHELQKERQLFYDRAITFLTRCQNSPTNDQEWAGDDGGFVYSPEESKAGSFTSYGSMSYAGMKSMIHAELDPDDPRVLAVKKYISNNYSVKENPGLGNTGLYYYYHTFAKGLNALGENEVVDKAGESHQWRTELAKELIATQDKEGWWVNENGRWWENDPVLVTCYCLLALEESAQMLAMPSKGILRK
jgi:squalene-hopene/tetraprenyl-beta-curcumene cyclase